MFLSQQSNIITPNMNPFFQAIHPYRSMHVCFGANSRLNRTLLHCNHPKEQYPCKCRSRARKAGKERRLSSGSIARVCYSALAATTQPVLSCSVCGCVALYFFKSANCLNLIRLAVSKRRDNSYPGTVVARQATWQGKPAQATVT